MQKEKLETLLNEAARSASSGPVSMDFDAITSLTDYANDIAERMLASAAILAQARGSTEITEQDIALIMAKKLGEEVAGHEYQRELHHQAMKSSLSASMGNKKEDITSQQQLSKKRARGG